MRNLLALAAAATLAFLGIGWFLGWYKIQSTTGSDGHRQINIDLNTNKIKQDVNKGKDKLRDILTPDKDGQPQNTQPTGIAPGNNTTGTTTSFRQNDGSYVFPGDNTPPAVPAPPSGNPRLPIPQ